MTGCSAPNCSNHSRNGFKFHRFPTNPERRKKWLKNCQRQDWNPTQADRLCSVHFEDSQMEQNRADGKKRLVPFAVPTIFNVSDPKKLLPLPKESRALSNGSTQIKIEEKVEIKLEDLQESPCHFQIKTEEKEIELKLEDQHHSINIKE